MKLREIGFIGNIIEVDGFAEMCIDEQFALHDALVDMQV